MVVATRPPTVLDGTLQIKVPLAPSVVQVQSGTPLAPTAQGWIPSKTPVLFAAESGRVGGEQVVAWRSVALDVHEDIFTPGDRYSIEDIAESGQVSYVKGNGPGVATSPSQIVFEGGAMGTAPTNAAAPTS